MKRRHFGVMILALFLGGCAEAEFRPYCGHGIVTKGLGGTVVRRNGMDVWMNGSPARRYRVLGVIDKEGDRHATGDSVLNACLVIAHQEGGNAVILLESNSVIPCVGLRNESFLGRPHVRVAVLRYF